MALSKQDKNRLDFLKMLVYTRVEEYFEKPMENDTSIPFGDIAYEIKQSARYVMRYVPRNIAFFGGSNYHYNYIKSVPDKNGALMPLPSDYQRYVRFRMKGWTRSVNEYMSDVSSAYEQQQFAMRRGSIEKPAVFLVPFHEEFDAGTADDILAVEVLGNGLPSEGDIDRKSVV